MLEPLRPRGPDAMGQHVWQGGAFGHTRLKVIDLSGGAQPMTAGPVSITYNGEIYNHAALRAMLSVRGCQFSSVSDTEVLLHGYLTWGLPGLLERVEGMFAFGLWDQRDNSLVLARDRMGQKPLFYSDASPWLVFASEVKAMLASPHVRATVSSKGLAAYLACEYLPGDCSIIDGVRKLLPGHYLTYRQGVCQTTQYWDMPFRDSPPPADPVATFTDLFDQAVERRLAADVPVGIFLSGGLDSSAVASAAVRAGGNGQVQTFSIAFDDASFDESDHARAVATHLGTKHTVERFRTSDLVERVRDIATTLDEPFGDASYLPTFLLCQTTRKHVTVALGGDGSDELLLGYPTFLADRFARLAHLPRTALRLLKGAASRLPVRDQNFSLDFKVNAFVRGLGADDATRHPIWLGSVGPHDKDPLAKDLRVRHSVESAFSQLVALYQVPATKHHLNRLSYQYCRGYLTDDILHKVDRASMANSLEVRAPFLDNDLVTFVSSLPPRFKTDGRKGKILLRKAMHARLPPAILERPKKGFGVPMSAWLRGPLLPLAAELLAPSRLRAAGYFDADVVSALMTEHLGKRANHRKMLWTLLAFELWRESNNIGGR